MGEKTILTIKRPKTNRETPASKIQKQDLSQPTSSPLGRILSLHQTIGNQAVQRLLKSGVIQTKLRIGKPGDIYEQEADRVADMVMRMPEPVIQRANQKCSVSSNENKLKTEKVKDAPVSYYGASFNHTFPSDPEGCNLQGIEVSELVDTVRNDFGIGATNVALGRKIWTLTAQNKLNKPDRIWTQAGMKGLGANPVNKWPAVLDQNQLFYYRNPGDKNWQLGPGIMIKLTLSGDLKRRESLMITTTDHGVSRTEPYRGPTIRIK